MKLYTKTGDSGSTGLFGGKRVEKDSPLIEACGALDELNASLGMALTHCDDDAIRILVTRIQGELFVAGADVATPLLEDQPSNTADVPRITSEMIARLETEIDSFSAEVGSLKHFILPGGSSAGAAFHLSRVICRRAERVLVHASRTEQISKNVLIYINRLSDYLFELARLVNLRSNKPETVWSRDSV